MEQLKDWMVRLSALSAWVCAAGMSLVLSRLGKGLVMGVQMYGGNPEPDDRLFPFPWPLVLPLLVLAALVTGKALVTRPARSWGLAGMAMSLITLASELRWFWQNITEDPP